MNAFYWIALHLQAETQTLDQELANETHPKAPIGTPRNTWKLEKCDAVRISDNQSKRPFLTSTTLVPGNGGEL